IVQDPSTGRCGLKAGFPCRMDSCNLGNCSCITLPPASMQSPVQNGSGEISTHSFFKRASYLLMNIVTTVALPARTPIELPNLEISLDIDSFSWSFTGQLWGASNLALIEPDGSWGQVFLLERSKSVIIAQPKYNRIVRYLISQIVTHDNGYSRRKT
ncbi:hypothetical protein, partial [Endozoicomonas sp.]|uniref:hypothetical protein n=1 Tax=Endozoicomonas sp. TaxID=1892382 RepID=UPI003839E8A1